jgi:hypothetical protein
MIKMLTVVEKDGFKYMHLLQGKDIGAIGGLVSEILDRDNCESYVLEDPEEAMVKNDQQAIYISVT